MKIKNLLWSFAALLALSACNSEVDIPQPVANGDEVIVTYSVKLPDAVQSRAYSDGTKAKNLHYALYDVTGVETGTIEQQESDGTLKPILSEDTNLVDGSADVNLHLIKGQKYQIVFWAQASNAPYAYHDNSRLVTVDYANANSNDDDLDAFFAFEEIDVECAYGRALFLTRAFAQINFGAQDLAEAKEMHLNVNRSTIKANLATQMNLRTKDLSGFDDVTFKYADVPSGETFPANEENATEDPYDYIAMNYVLAPVEETKIDVTLMVDNGKFARNFPDIPIRLNHRTNISGNIFTDAAGYQVSIRKEYDVEPWDGTSTVAKGPNGDVIEIGTAAELARLSEKSNKDGKTYEEDNFVLTQDIDLNCKPWDPIGAAEVTDNVYGFVGTFDGNGKTIYNLHIDLDKLQTTGRIDYYDDGSVEATYDEVYRYAGLFGRLYGATIKNLTIENVIIHNNTDISSGLSYTGILAGFATKTHFENVKIKGIVVVTADGSFCDAKSGYIGGLIGEAGDGCTFDGINIQVEDGSYVSGSDCACVGGVIGLYMNNNGTTNEFKGVKSNLNVTASNPLGNKTSVGGLIGEITDYSETLTNCSCSATVTFNNYAGAIKNEDGQDVLNSYNMVIGGLAGQGYRRKTYFGNTSPVFTFKNCSFTGKIISNFINESGFTTDYTETVKTNNTNWEYMGWIDGSPFQSNDGWMTITTE
jgi:hypothetical protein